MSRNLICLCEAKKDTIGSVRRGSLGCDVSIDHKFRHAQEGAWHTSHGGKLSCIILKTSTNHPLTSIVPGSIPDSKQGQQ